MRDTYDRALLFMMKEVQGGASPLEVAAVLNTLSMSMYRTVLDAEDYQRMAQTVYDRREEVKSFGSDSWEPGSLH